MANERDDEQKTAEEAARGLAPRGDGERDGGLGGSLGAGQSGGGGYRNQDDQAPGGIGGQSHQGYYGGGQMGDRNYGATDHSAASKGKTKKRS